MRELCDPLQSTSLNGFVGGIPIRDPAARLSQQISKAMLLLTERAGSNLGAGKHRFRHSRARKLSTGVSVKKLFGVENNSALFGLVISGSTVRRRVLAMYWYSCPLCPEVYTLFIFTTCLCVCGYKLLPFRVFSFFCVQKLLPIFLLLVVVFSKSLFLVFILFLLLLLFLVNIESVCPLWCYLFARIYCGNTTVWWTTTRDGKRWLIRWRSVPVCAKQLDFFFFSYVFLRLQLGILFTIDAPSLTDPAYDDCDKFHLFFSSYLLTPRIQIFEHCRVRETYIPAWLLTIIAWNNPDSDAS